MPDFYAVSADCLVIYFWVFKIFTILRDKDSIKYEDDKKHKNQIKSWEVKKMGDFY